MSSQETSHVMRMTAAKVLATETLVIAGLWLLGRYFSS
jgi:hypothetical protein